MFERLFKRPSVIARHKNAPFPEERARYLAYCSEQGYTKGTLLFKARELLWVARKLTIYRTLGLTPLQIKAAARNWGERQRCCGRSLNVRWTETRFYQVASPWLKFLGCLHKPLKPTPFNDKLEDFVTWMRNERGLTPTTVKVWSRYIRQFLLWYRDRKQSLSAVQLEDIDDFLRWGREEGWCRITVRNRINGLKAFFRYLAQNGRCSSDLQSGIQGPRAYSQESLPIGPKWPDVTRLLKSMNTNRPVDLRDRPIVILFAIYGLRASEASKIKLDHIDWEHDLIRVPRAKRRSPDILPLTPTLGNALLAYLESVRPASAWREVFLTLTPPFRPLSRSALYSIVARRLTALEIQSRHRGPHSLRHACATHLISAGFPLKEISDHLGHRSASSTQIYAKVDISGLREVASFDLGGLA